MGMGVTVGVALLVGEALAEHALLTPRIVVVGDGRAVDMAGAGKAAAEQRVTHALLIDAGLGPQGVQRRRGCIGRPLMQALKPRHSSAVSGRNRRARSLAAHCWHAVRGVVRQACNAGRSRLIFPPSTLPRFKLQARPNAVSSPAVLELRRRPGQLGQPLSH